MEDTPATRQATRARIGPWHVLQTRNPSAPGMKFSTLLSLVKKGQVTPKSVVRGPTTNQFWALAINVKGLSREFGHCFDCGAEMESTANICPRCQKLQEPPVNPDVLLEGQSGLEHRRPRPYVPEPTINVDMDDAPAPKPSTVGVAAAPAPGGPVNPNAGILTAKELATAFQLGFTPPKSQGKPAGKTKKKFLVRSAALLAMLGIAAAVVGYLQPELRERSIDWVKQTSETLKARFDAQRQPPISPESKAPKGDPAVIDEAPTVRIDPMMAAPDRHVESTIEKLNAKINDLASQSESAVDQTTEPVNSAETEIEPIPASRTEPPASLEQPAAAFEPPAEIEFVPASTEAGRLDQVRTFWRAAIDAEGKQDYVLAVKNYELIKKLPRDLWPQGLDVRLNQARKQLP
jgi:hypothetical protein